MKKLSIVIPCYNEEEGIPNLAVNLTPILKQLEQEYSTELIFVDDGSTDKTNELIQQKFKGRENVRIIKHPKNMNLGVAMRTGFKHANGDLIVTFDSDCTYNPTVIIEMLKMMDEQTSLVTASPYHPSGKVENIPEYRLFLSKAITLIYRILTGSSIHTYTALVRVQTKDLAKNIHFKSNNFLATAEMLIYSLMKGHKVKELPTTLSVRKYGVSKMKLLLVIKSHFIFVLQLLKMRLNGKLKKENTQ